MIQESLSASQSGGLPFALNVIISHADSDHYSWIEKVLEGLKPSKKSPPVKVHFLLGGRESDYSEGFRNKILRFAHDKELHYSLSYDSLRDIPLIQCIGGTCTILAAERTADTNRNSLVLKIEDSAGFSTILTGDAPGATTRGILERYRTSPDFPPRPSSAS